jgi:hypothetical protein
MEHPNKQYGNLTPAEEEVAWYPMRSVRDLTLNDQDLQNHCPLSQYRGHGKPRYSLGSFDILPLEVLYMILPQLDIQSLLSLQRTNRQVYDAVHELPQLKAIIQHSPDVLRGILSTETAPFIQCQQLFDKLTSSSCESCSHFGGYLYLLTCTRVCFSCFTQLPRYRPILRLHARRQFRLSTNDVRRLPQLNSLPGDYTITQASCQKRIVLVDFDTARQAGISIEASASDVEPHVTLPATQRTTRSHGRVAQRIGEGVVRCPGPSSNIELRDDFQYNAKRFMAIVEIPYLDIRNGRAYWGFCCYACHGEFGDLRHSRRQFLAAGFRDHLRQCGEVVDDRHVSPVVGEDL